MAQKRKNQRNSTGDSNFTEDTVSDLGTSTASAASAARRRHSKPPKVDSSNSEPKRKDSSSPEEIMNETYFLKHEDKRPFITKKRFVFTAGIVFGLIIAYSIMSPQNPHLKIFSNYLAESFADLDFSNILPAHIMVEELFGNITLFLKPNITLLEDTEFLPGLHLAEKGLKANFPVILIPGIVSTVIIMLISIQSLPPPRVVIIIKFIFP